MYDFSRYTFVYFLKNKFEVKESFIAFKNWIENRFSIKIKIVRSDHGREYINNSLKDFFTKCGIEHQNSVAYCPQQNGRSERANRSLIQMARTILIDAGLDKKFWEEAIATAAHLQNRSPKNLLNGMTPYELWHNKTPDLSYLRIFVSKALVYIKRNKRTKMDKVSLKAIFFRLCNE